MPAATTPGSGYGMVATWSGHDIGFLRDINGPEITMETIPLDSQDAANDFIEYAPGLLDGGEVTFTCLSVSGDTSGQSQMMTSMLARTSGQMVVTLPDSTAKWTLTGLMTRISPAYPYKGEMVTDYTVKVSGKPVFSTS